MPDNSTANCVSILVTMRLSVLLLTTGLFIIGGVRGVFDNCNYYQEVAVGQIYYAYNPNYPNWYTGENSCTWDFIAPSNSRVVLNCTIDIPVSSDCSLGALTISPQGNGSRTDFRKLCGVGKFDLELIENHVILTFPAPYYSKGGRFLCEMKAILPATAEPKCECGWWNKPRIVGGNETGVTEYPMMAGIVDLVLNQIYCGGTIISRKYVLTAAHCLVDRIISRAAVVVGEHAVTTDRNTNATQLLRINRATIHPGYSPYPHIQNDIAIVQVATDITFSMAVGPACLPFGLPEIGPGTDVVALGWGLLEFGGMKPTTLQGVTLNTISLLQCAQYYDVTANNFCTFTPGKDTCQMDSGGPLLYRGTQGTLFLVGIISYGTGCASNSPGVNTRVYPYIEWIQSVTTGADYCVKRNN